MSAKRLFRLIFTISTLVFITVFYFNRWYLFFSLDNLNDLREFFLQFGYISPLIILLLSLLFSIFFLPTGIFAVLLGFLYGSITGVLISWFSISLGMLISFLISRYLFQGKFLQKFGSKKMVTKFEKYLEGNQFKTVFLLRLMMIIPYNIQNYTFGLTKINWVTYISASTLGILLVTILNVRLGSLISILGTENITNDILRKNGIITIGSALVFFSLITIVKKILNNENGNKI